MSYKLFVGHNSDRKLKVGFDVEIHLGIFLVSTKTKEAWRRNVCTSTKCAVSHFQRKWLRAVWRGWTLLIVFLLHLTALEQWPFIVGRCTLSCCSIKTRNDSLYTFASSLVNNIKKSCCFKPLVQSCYVGKSIWMAKEIRLRLWDC